jgi:thioesterase domain-containing protein/acyl carrier protein
VAPREPLEHQIAGIFEELFEIAPIGATDDFFDLGGDSLLAATLMSAIDETCGRTLDPSVLLEASTVAALAAALHRQDHAFDEPLTVLRASGARSPFFFVHNDHGRGLYTHGLARALDPDRPVCAIHLHGLGARRLPDTVEAIAAERVRAMRVAWPHGPYVLGGHCFGGIVALEMARQLRATGEPVEAVVMIDSPAPAWRARTLHRVSRGLERLGGVAPATRIALLADVDRAAEALVGTVRSVGTRLVGLARAGPRRQVRAVGRRLVWSARWLSRLAGAGHGPALHPAPPQIGADAWQGYARAIRRYVPVGYEGAVTLFRAEALPAARPDLGWARVLPRLEIEVIPGDHHTCVTRHVAAFAAQLEARLRRAP